MRILPQAAGLLLTVVTALLLSGCIPPGSTVTPEPLPSSTPVFASEEEALSAAEAAYREYLAVSDAILGDGGANPERIEDVVTGNVARTEKEGFLEFLTLGYQSIGQTTFGNASLQQFDPNSPDGIDLVIIYVCSDVSGVDVVDSSGTSVVSPGRPSTTAFQIGFDFREAAIDGLVISSKEVWSGPGVCK